MQFSSFARNTHTGNLIMINVIFHVKVSSNVNDLILTEK